jgi:transcriptional regulator of acetoin/glycerol metabolism
MRAMQSCPSRVTVSRSGVARLAQREELAGEVRMANATDIRYADERSRSSADAPWQEQPHPQGYVGRAAAPIVAATEGLDRLYELIRGSGFALQLTDANGAVVYERSDRLLSEVPNAPEAGALNACAPHSAPTLILTASSRPAQEALTLQELAGEDPQMLRNVRSAYRITDSNVSVLIQGPTGSGKEAFAHAMHLASQRAHRAFVAVNCAAIPETLIESELFGYKPGAFTGARREGMRGRILQSDAGTLFLDEIGDMPLALQSRLLRVLEEQEVTPLGSETAIKVHLHVIAASHRNLREMIACGAFREDLYYRLNGITLELPALRDRIDKERLVRQALAAETGNGRPAAIERDALQRLLAYSWPGNVRELRNVIRTALAICDGGVVRGIDLPREIRTLEWGADIGAQAAGAAGADGAPTNALQAAERAALLRVIEDCQGNMTRVAAQLGMSRNTLYRRIKRHNIPLAHGPWPALAPAPPAPAAPL